MPSFLMLAIKFMLNSQLGFSFSLLCGIIRLGTPFGVFIDCANLIIPKASAFLKSIFKNFLRKPLIFQGFKAESLVGSLSYYNVNT